MEAPGASSLWLLEAKRCAPPARKTQQPPAVRPPHPWPPPAPASPSPRSFAEEDRSAAATSIRYWLKPGTYVVGKPKHSEVAIDEDKSISRKHGEVRRPAKLAGSPTDAMPRMQAGEGAARAASPPAIAHNAAAAPGPLQLAVPPAGSWEGGDGPHILVTGGLKQGPWQGGLGSPAACGGPEEGAWLWPKVQRGR